MKRQLVRTKSRIGQDIVGRGIEYITKNADKLIDDASLKWAVRTGLTYPTLSGPKMYVPMKSIFERGKSIVSPIVNTLSKKGFSWGKFGFSVVAGTIVGTAVDIELNDKTWQEAVPENLIITMGSLAFATTFTPIGASLLVGLGIDYAAVKMVDFIYNHNLFFTKSIVRGMTEGLNYISNKTNEFMNWLEGVFDKSRVEEYKNHLEKLKYKNPSRYYIDPIDLSEFNSNYKII